MFGTKITYNGFHFCCGRRLNFESVIVLQNSYVGTHRIDNRDFVCFCKVCRNGKRIFEDQWHNQIHVFHFRRTQSLTHFLSIVFSHIVNKAFDVVSFLFQYVQGNSRSLIEVYVFKALVSLPFFLVYIEFCESQLVYLFVVERQHQCYVEFCRFLEFLFRVFVNDKGFVLNFGYRI